MLQQNMIFRQVSVQTECSLSTAIKKMLIKNIENIFQLGKIIFNIV